MTPACNLTCKIYVLTTHIDNEVREICALQWKHMTSLFNSSSYVMQSSWRGIQKCVTQNCINKNDIAMVSICASLPQLKIVIRLSQNSACYWLQRKQNVRIHFSSWVSVPYVCLPSAGGGVVHVGVMLRAAERGDGHGNGADTAAGLRSRGGALPLCPQRRVLYLPPHQLRERRAALQGLRAGLLRLQTQGKHRRSLELGGFISHLGRK